MQDFRYRFMTGSVIRSDGWAAYSGLHPSDTRSIASRGNNTIHQVINHSVAYSGRDMVLGNNTVEDINTNMIEGVWKDIKNAIHGRNYNERDLPGKLMEFLWRRANKEYIQVGMERCLREVSFDSSIRSREHGDNDDGIITRGANGNPPEVEAEYQARVARRRATDLARYRARRSRNNRETLEDIDRANRGREYERSLEDPITLPEDSSESDSEEDFDFADSDEDYLDLTSSTSTTFPPPPPFASDSWFLGILWTPVDYGF
ncbi:unnamed protein product [Mucor hiemalis]